LVFASWVFAPSVFASCVFASWVFASRVFASVVAWLAFGRLGLGVDVVASSVRIVWRR
jgi:hypothetical protein